MPTVKLIHSSGICMQVGDVREAQSIRRALGVGLTILGYYYEKKWAFAPLPHGYILGIKGTELQEGSNWMEKHEFPKNSKVLKTNDERGRPYVLISVNDGYVPARLDADPELKDWATLASTIKVVFDEKCRPHPVCEEIDYEKHGFQLLRNRFWWPISLQVEKKSYIDQALKKVCQTIQLNAKSVLKDLPSSVVIINNSILALSSEIYDIIELLNRERRLAPLGEREDQQFYEKLLNFLTSSYERYDGSSIQDKVDYLRELNGELIKKVRENYQQFRDEDETKENEEILFRKELSWQLIDLCLCTGQKIS